MPPPTLVQVIPSEGSPAGGDLLRLVGASFGPNLRVELDGVSARVLGLWQQAGHTFAELRSPPHAPGPVELVLSNLDASGTAIPGERTTWPSAYHYVRASLVQETDLSRVVRQVLRLLKQQVLENSSLAVSVEYDDTPTDGQSLILLAKLPAVALAGPTLRPNRFYSQNVLREQAVVGPLGLELQRVGPSATVDLVFSLTGASTRTSELLHLMTSVAAFLHRQRWLELPRDPANAALGTVRWELDPEGEMRSQPLGRDDVRAFSCGFVLRGFDIHEGVPIDRGQRVVTPELQTRPFERDEP